MANVNRLMQLVQDRGRGRREKGGKGGGKEKEMGKGGESRLTS